jgi:hypothetical protein
VTVSAAALRGLLGGASVALLVSLVAVSPAGRTAWTSALVGAALVAWVVVSPGSPAPTVLVLVGLLMALDAGPAPWPLLVVQAACLSGDHLLASLCALTGRTAEWEVAALVPPARRWLVAQGVCVPLALLAAAVPREGLGPGLDVAGGVLVLGVVGGLLALARARRRRA